MSPILSKTLTDFLAADSALDRASRQSFRIDPKLLHDRNQAFEALDAEIERLELAAQPPVDPPVGLRAGECGIMAAHTSMGKASWLTARSMGVTTTMEVEPPVAKKEPEPIFYPCCRGSDTAYAGQWDTVSQEDPGNKAVLEE